MNVMVWVLGRDWSKLVFVVYGYFDVVLVMVEDWSVDLFVGIVKDGMFWGCGVVDMKNMNVMIFMLVVDIFCVGE